MSTQDLNEYENGDVVFSFGIGCFHFGAKYEPDFRIDYIRDYTQKLENYLGSYAGITNISISEFDITRGKQSIIASDDDAKITDGFGIFPWPADWKTEFSIHIPSRVQSEIMEKYGRTGDFDETEDYLVTTIYSGAFPVTFISGIDGVIGRPSDSVVLVREYLLKFAPNDQEIEFQFLGPSPFHANFFVELSNESSFNIHRQPGYDDVVYTVPTPSHLAVAIHAIQSGITEELGIFYESVQNRNRLRKYWSEISSEIEAIADKLSEKPHWVQSIRGFFRSPQFSETSINLVQYEIEVEQEIQSLQSRLHYFETNIGTSRFSEYTQKEIEIIQNHPVEKFRRILNTSENHRKSIGDYRTSLFVSVIGLIAACLGGAAGALLTAALS